MELVNSYSIYLNNRREHIFVFIGDLSGKNFIIKKDKIKNEDKHLINIYEDDDSLNSILIPYDKYIIIDSFNKLERLIKYNESIVNDILNYYYLVRSEINEVDSQKFFFKFRNIFKELSEEDAKMRVRDH